MSHHFINIIEAYSSNDYYNGPIYILLQGFHST